MIFLLPTLYLKLGHLSLLRGGSGSVVYSVTLAQLINKDYGAYTVG